MSCTKIESYSRFIYCGGSQAKDIWEQDLEPIIIIIIIIIIINFIDFKQNDELLSLFRSANIVRMIKSRRLRRAHHVVRIEEGSR